MFFQFFFKVKNSWVIKDSLGEFFLIYWFHKNFRFQGQQIREM